jgi:hypothetical protein
VSMGERKSLWRRGAGGGLPALRHTARRSDSVSEQSTTVPAFLVVQQREYRKHQIEVLDRGKAGCTIVVRPPPSMGAAWEVPPEGATPTLAERLKHAKARIDDATGGSRPSQHTRHALRNR